MRTKVRTILAITVVLAMVAVAALTVATEQPVYAKGAVKSSGGNSSNSSSNSDSKSSSSSDSKSSSGSNSSSSSNSHESSNSSSSSHESSSGSNHSGGSSGSSNSQSHSAINNSRSESRTYQSPSGSSGNRLDDQFYLRSQSSRPDSRRPTPTYRKEYADIGDLWRNRQEKRNTGIGRDSDQRRYDSNQRRYDDDNRRGGLYYDRPYDRNWGGGRSYGSPFRYRNYYYDYRPTFCYPSPYCYYYDYYPPYIGYDRVIVRFFSPHVFIEIPVFIYQKESNYYLSNRTDRELWSVLGEIQRAWERSDVEPIMDHVRKNSTIDVSLKGEYTYSVDWLDYYDMTRDAMSVVRTRSFSFDRVTRRDGDLYVAHGMHTYADESGLQKTVYISYTFERDRDEWYIVAVGSSTMPI